MFFHHKFSIRSSSIGLEAYLPPTTFDKPYDQELLAQGSLNII